MVTAATGEKAAWKALLKPAAAGGNYSITAKCTAGCTGEASIVDVTFGDVWYCSGQSVSALKLPHLPCLIAADT